MGQGVLKGVRGTTGALNSDQLLHETVAFVDASDVDPIYHRPPT